MSFCVFLSLQYQSLTKEVGLIERVAGYIDTNIFCFLARCRLRVRTKSTFLLSTIELIFLRLWVEKTFLIKPVLSDDSQATPARLSIMLFANASAKTSCTSEVSKGVN